MNDLNIIKLDKKNTTDFALERNKLLKASKSKWVLFLDNDEKLSGSIDNLSDSVDGYYLFRKNYFLGIYVGMDKILRLARKGAGTWKRAVHEVWDISGNTKILKTYIIHNTATNLTDYINKINNYSTLHAQANLKEGKKSTIFKIILFPIAKFVVTLIKSKNVVFSIMQSLHSFLSWTKLYFLQS